MGRGRGKAKKHSSARDVDNGSGEDEKLPPIRRRGRPQKLSKDDFEDDDIVVEKIEEDREETKGSVVNTNDQATATENGKKRKRPSQIAIKEDADLVNDPTKTCVTNLIKYVGYRHIGSRRKNKPRRAAEVGVECI